MKDELFALSEEKSRSIITCFCIFVINEMYLENLDFSNNDKMKMAFYFDNKIDKFIKLKRKETYCNDKERNN